MEYPEIQKPPQGKTSNNKPKNSGSPQTQDQKKQLKEAENMKATKFFEGIKTLQELKQKYKELAKIHHPDRGGDLQTMQAINNEYDSMIKHFEKYGSKTEKEAATAEAQNPGIFKRIIEELLKMPGVKIEICGYWIWIDNAGRYLNKIKSLGFCWSKSHKRYYYSGDTTGTKHRGSGYSMNKIRMKYGSTEIENTAKETFLS